MIGGPTCITLDTITAGQRRYGTGTAGAAPSILGPAPCVARSNPRTVGRGQQVSGVRRAGPIASSRQPIP